jgi:hypothetical protein
VPRKARLPLRELDIHGLKYLRAFEEILAPLAELPAHGHQGVTLQVYVAVLASLLVSLWTGRKPTQRTFEMIGLYFQGWATAEELTRRIESLKTLGQGARMVRAHRTICNCCCARRAPLSCGTRGPATLALNLADGWSHGSKEIPNRIDRELPIPLVALRPLQHTRCPRIREKRFCKTKPFPHVAWSKTRIRPPKNGFVSPRRTPSAFARFSALPGQSDASFRSPFRHVTCQVWRGRYAPKRRYHP